MLATATIVLLIVLIWAQKIADFSKLVQIRSKTYFFPSNMMLWHPKTIGGLPATGGTPWGKVDSSDFTDILIALFI